MTVDLTEDDRGKEVVRTDQRLGVVTDVESGTAYVDADFDHVPPDLAERLGWAEEKDVQPLDEDMVTEVRNAELRLRTDI